MVIADIADWLAPAKARSPGSPPHCGACGAEHAEHPFGQR
jgi:hypothetical protein